MLTIRIPRAGGQIMDGAGENRFGRESLRRS